ncbi:MAG: hypothetical protein ABIG84_05710, partial [archaeon]
MKRLNLSDMQDVARKRGGRCLSENYTNTSNSRLTLSFAKYPQNKDIFYPNLRIREGDNRNVRLYGQYTPASSQN